MQSFPPSNHSDRKILPELTPSEKASLRKSLLEPVCGTNPNWTWSEVEKKEWKVTTGAWQQFYERWRDSSVGSKFDNQFPYTLELGVDLEGNSLLPFHDGETSKNRILVTKSYEDMFYRLLRLRKKDMGQARGAVITGQPGVGKTTFLKFMLARLISADQVVVLCGSLNIYLFYQGRVYMRLTQFGLGDFPEHQGKYCPVWTLIDVDFNDRGPPLDSTSNAWPIQASSPNRIRWKSWLKQYQGAKFGMPLWNMEELVAGLCLQPEYNDFRSILETLLLLGGSTLPTTDKEAIDAALEVLRMEREKEKVVEAEENEDRDEMGNDISASATDQDEDIVDEAGQPRAPIDNVDNALKILVHNATEEFGFAPRDVYNGVFRLSQTREGHATALENFDCAELREIVKTFNVQLGLVSGHSHRVVVVFPYPPEHLNFDGWGIDFKSIQIREKMMELMRLQEDEPLWELYEYFRGASDSSTLAGWVFEAIVHRMFPDGWQSGSTPQPIRMASNGCVPPVFSTDPSSSTPDTLLFFKPLRADTRTVTRVDFTSRQLSGVTLDNGKYYIPTVANDSLIDSFTIDSDRSSHTVVISIFQITIFTTHGGSAEGYLRIRKIMRHVRGLLKEKEFNAAVKVVYFLVCPDDKSQHEWQMPVNWEKSTKVYDHRGDGFCIRVPVPRRRAFY